MVRYQEARHIGEGLARDAVASLATEIDADAALDGRRQPDAARPRRRSSKCRVPGEGPCTSWPRTARPARRRCSAPSAATASPRSSPGRRCAGCSRCCAAPSSPGGRSRSVERHTRGRRQRRRDLPRRRARRRRRSTSRSLPRGAARARRARARRSASARCCRRPARCSLGADDVPGFGWRTYRAVEGDGPETAARSPGFGMLANDHLRVDRRPATTARSRSRPRTASRSAAPTGSSTAATAATPTTTRRPTTTCSSTGRTSVRVDDRRVRTRAGPPARRRGVPSGRATRSATSGACVRRGEETALVEVRTTLELARARAVRARPRRVRQPLPRPPAARALPAAGAGRRLGTPSARSPSSSGASRPRADRTSAACRRSCRAASSTAPTATSALARPPRRPARVRGGRRRHASSRSRCCARPATSRAPSSQLRPNPAGPLDPLEGPQLQGHHVVEYAVAAPPRRLARRRGCYDAADEFLVPLERVRGGGLPGASRPPIGSDAPRRRAPASPRSRREPGGLVVRRVQPVPAPVDRRRRARRRAGARGWIVDLLGGPLEPFAGEVALGAWEIATLQPRLTACDAPGGLTSLVGEREHLDGRLEAGDRARPEGDDWHCRRRGGGRSRRSSTIWPGSAHADEARREVHDRAEQVALADEHLARREPDPHRRAASGRPRPPRAAPASIATASTASPATNIASSPMSFTSRGARPRRRTSTTTCSNRATSSSSSVAVRRWASAVNPTRSAKPTTASVVLCSRRRDAPQRVAPARDRRRGAGARCRAPARAAA